MRNTNIWLKTVIAGIVLAGCVCLAGCKTPKPRAEVMEHENKGNSLDTIESSSSRTQESESHGTKDTDRIVKNTNQLESSSREGSPDNTRNQKTENIDNVQDLEWKNKNQLKDTVTGIRKENGPEQKLGQLLERKELILETETGCYEALPSKDGAIGILVSTEFVKQVLEINVLEYPDGKILLQQGNISIRLQEGAREMISRTEVLSLTCAPYRRDNHLYLPLEAICEGFGYKAKLPLGSWRIYLESEEPYRDRSLPKVYDYRKVGRSTKVRDQGSFGTCWSFASLTSLETSLLPKMPKEFSADHMSLHNSFSLGQREGGEYTMSMAYLLAWQGPVLEEEDPYGDEFSPDGLKPSVHIQEIQILPEKDYEAIKKAVFFHGGVQSSLYTSLNGSSSESVYYNREKSAYCYQGELVPNHDVVIVGWDDHYPKENFEMEIDGDGAFLCVSSWGEDFGEQGYFYVSYHDSNIGSINLVYTGIESVDNYDYIYQSDLCGWVGQVGYGVEKAFGANVFEAKEEEELNAVGFYATGEDTSYVISLAHDVAGQDSLEHRKVVAKGTIKYSGFYTIPLKVSERINAGERFAVILEANTPKAVHPIAVEYRADDATEQADVTDGEGYISIDGIEWECIEDSYQCNLCLKGYTTKVNEQS